MRSLFLASVLVASSAFAEEATAVLPDQGRHELLLVPVDSQLNDEYSYDFAVGAAYIWHAREELGVTLRFNHNTHHSISPRLEDAFGPHHDDGPFFHPTTRWSLVAGTELAPIKGSGVLFGRDVAVSAVLVGAVGAVRLDFFTAGSDARPQFSFDAGIRPAAEIGIGGRLKLGRHFAVRFEITDLVMSDRKSTMNGCSFTDLNAMDLALRQGGSISDVGVSAGCRGGFDDNPNDVPLALNLVRAPDASLRQTFSLRFGLSLLF